MSASAENTSFAGKEQPNLVAQLLWAMKSMHQFDEMFCWLASTLIQHFHVSLAQFWTPPSHAGGAVRLLAAEAQDPSVPERVVQSEEIRQWVKRLSTEWQVSRFFPLEQAFSSYQTTRL